MSDKFYEIVKSIKNDKEYHLYNTQDFSFYAYSMVKMMQPNMVIEIGTGTGSVTFMCAQAMKESGKGKIISIDDGSQHDDDYFSNINEKIKKFELEEYIDFRNDSVKFDLEDLSDIGNVDIIFNDCDHGQLFLYGCLIYLLARTDKHSYLIIDCGADWNVWSETELLVGALNRGDIPKKMYEYIDKSDNQKLDTLVRDHIFYFDFFKKDHGLPNSPNHQVTFAKIHISKKNHIHNLVY